jgi:hypothetical protein
LKKNKRRKPSPYFKQRVVEPQNKQADSNAAKGQAKQDIATVARPEAAAIPEPPPTPRKDGDPNKKWTNDPPMFIATAVGVVVAAFVCVFTFNQWRAANEANVASWEQGRAHLEVADTPESTIKVTTDRDGVATISGVLFVANQGPSDAYKTNIEAFVGFEKLNERFEFFEKNVIFGGFIQPDKIAAANSAASPKPIGVPFSAKFKTQLWIPFALGPGGVIHVKARIGFTDIYRHRQEDDVEATVVWGTGQLESFSSQHLERRVLLPTVMRPDGKH